MSFTVIIPARHASTRFPGKPLALINGQPMIRHVVENALKSDAQRVVVATDDQRIADAVKSFGAEVCMTSDSHQSGTDRLAEAVSALGLGEEEIVVNVQGDEPGMPPAVIAQVAATLGDSAGAVMATACWPIASKAEFNDPNVVKVVSDNAGHALYFSRSPIPYPRNGGNPPACRHIGIYAYRAGFLPVFTSWPVAALERAESLEQLRVLAHGERIAVCVAAEKPGEGIDTPEDLQRFVQSISSSAR